MTTMLSGAAFAMATVTDGQETSDGATLTYPVVKADAPEAQQRINMGIETAPKDIYMDANGHIHVLIQRYEAASYAAGILDIDLDA